MLALPISDRCQAENSLIRERLSSANRASPSPILQLPLRTANQSKRADRQRAILLDLRTSVGFSVPMRGNEKYPHIYSCSTLARAHSALARALAALARLAAALARGIRGLARLLITLASGKRALARGEIILARAMSTLASHSRVAL